MNQNQNQHQNVIALISHQRRPVGRRGEGVRRVRSHPSSPTDTRGPLFLLISDLKRSEVGVLFYSNLL